MKKMRFAQFVLNEIKINGMQLTKDFMDQEFYVDPRREYHSDLKECFNSLSNQDDWNLSISWFFGWSINLTRGPRYTKIILNKEEKQEFVELHKQQIKNINKFKLEDELKSLREQYWYY